MATQPYHTNYALALKKYKTSDGYDAALKILMDAGIKEPYAGNVLRCAFDEGWHASGVKIVQVKPKSCPST